jgi:hypothetical protein
VVASNAFVAFKFFYVKSFYVFFNISFDIFINDENYTYCSLWARAAQAPGGSTSVMLQTEFYLLHSFEYKYRATSGMLDKKPQPTKKTLNTNDWGQIC